MSIKKKLSSVFVGLSIALLILISTIQYLSYAKQFDVSVDNLITEQVFLIINKLDRYRVHDQNSFVARTIHQLKKVKSVALFDLNCKLLIAKPRNAKAANRCPDKSGNLLLIDNKNIFSQSSGAIRYIFIEKEDFSRGISGNVLFVMIVLPISIILIFLILLRVCLARYIFRPLDNFGTMVSSNLRLPDEKNINASFPKEFNPIVSGLKKREILLDEAQEKLVKQVKLEAYMKISQQVAHDIKSPLGAFKAAATSIINHPHNASRLIDRAITRMEEILKDLHLSLGSVRSTSVSNNFFLKETLYQILQEKRFEYANLNIEVSPKSDFSADTLVGNRSDVLRVLSNLINNSIEASSEHPRINIRVDRSDSQVKVSIADNGSGIGEKDILKVTDFGYTSKAKGLGIGLAHAKEVMESFGGSFSIESNLNIGTTIHLFFKICSSAVDKVR